MSDKAPTSALVHWPAYPRTLQTLESRTARIGVPDTADQNIISPSCLERSPVMVRLFHSMHLIASQRGDGLRPELVRLLEQSRNSALLLDGANVNFWNYEQRLLSVTPSRLQPMARAY
jgi:hypothetical protein